MALLLTEAEILAELTIARAKLSQTIGIRSTQFADQATTFDNEALISYIARLEGLLAVARTGSSTRYAATSKGA